MQYGGAVPGLTYSISGFVNGDTADVVSGAAILTCPATVSSGVGSYPISVAATALSAANYDFPSENLLSSTLTVTPAPLTITADNQSTVYEAPTPDLTASYSGFVNGDTPDDLAAPVTLSTDATSSSPVGTYTIDASGASSANYQITFVDGTLTVGKALLAVSANDQSKLTGAAVPPLTYYLTGFVNGENATSAGVTGTATLSTTAGVNSPAGTYAIVAAPGTLAAANYDFTAANGLFIIATRPLTVISQLTVPAFQGISTGTVALATSATRMPSPPRQAIPQRSTGRTATRR